MPLRMNRGKDKMVRVIIAMLLLGLSTSSPSLSRPQTPQAPATSQITLSWDKPEQGDKTGYLLSKKEPNSDWVTVMPTLSWSSVCGSSSRCSYTGSATSNLTPGVQYCFRLQAADDYTNLDPKITFSEDYGDASDPICKIAPLPVPKDPPTGR